MERRAWNKLKTEVLDLLKDILGATSKDVSANLEVSTSNAGMILHRLHKQKLADRRKPNIWKTWRKPPFHYSINERGLARLEYLRKFELNASTRYAPRRSNAHERVL
jgi:predicted transcriptional regulator